jgi:hypothetical protein
MLSGLTCVIKLQFYSNTAQVYDDLLRLTYSGGPSPNADYKLKANSTTQAVMRFYDLVYGGWNGGPFDFGMAGTPITATLLIRNDGLSAGMLPGADTPLGLPSGFSWPTSNFPGIPAANPSVVEPDANGYPFSVTRCNGTLSSGAYCALRITFTPTGTQNTSGNLSIPVSSGFPTTLNRYLQGTGTTNPRIVIREDFNPASRCTDSWSCNANMGGIPNGDFTTRNFIVHNVGGTLEYLPLASLPTITQSYGNFRFGAGASWPGTGSVLEVPASSGVTFNPCASNTGDWYLSPGDACSFQIYYTPNSLPDGNNEGGTINIPTSSGTLYRNLFGGRCDSCI